MKKLSEKPKSIILIIDDSKERQREISEIISSDYYIMPAANSHEAKTCLNNDYKRISVIILSNIIQGECPSDLVKQIKSNPTYKKIPILIFCRNQIDEEAKNCLIAGASDVFFEPADRTLVLNRIHNVVNLTEAANILAEIEKDDLTGLYTRQAFIHRARTMINNAPNKNFGILALDFENFKLTNSQYGEDKCNEFLAYVAQRLKNGAKTALVGRFGGDQFVVIYERAQDKTLERLNSIVASIMAEAPIPHQVLKIGSYAPIDTSLPIVRCCDYAFLAIGKIKGVYGKNFAVYEESLQQQLLNDQKILENMERALLEDQFKVFYQPKHESVTGRIAGAEALVRWNHPVYGFMAPSQFIPLFEKSGFISKLDSFIVKKVCSDIKRWQENGIPVVPISINVSRRDYFENGWLFEQLKTVDDNNIDHSLLHMEVTESLYAENTEFIINQVKRAQDFGFLIEMDDFGAGYSSLGMLSTFPLDIIKLDISFVQNLETNQIVIENIIKMAHSMGLFTIAEGVETEEQFKILQSFGCDMIQGFYFSRPLSEEDYEKYLRKNACTLSKIKTPVFDEVTMHKSKRSFSEISLIANYLPGAFFSFHLEKDDQIIGINKEILELFECDSSEEFRMITENSFTGMVVSEDLEHIKQVFAENKQHYMEENRVLVVDFRIITKNKAMIKVRDYIRFIDTKDFGLVCSNILLEIPE